MRARLGSSPVVFFSIGLLTVVGVALPASADDEVAAPIVTITPAGEWITAPDAVEASWTLPAGPELAGWAVAVDGFPETDPGGDVTQTDPSWWSWLDDGVTWLHVRAIAADGRLGTVAHTRIAVDTVSPEVIELSSLSHPSGVVSEDASVAMAWSVIEGGSGVAGYQVLVTDPTALAPEAEQITTTASHATVEVPEDGVWSIGVRAVDNAGLWGPFVTYEVMVDAAAPGQPAVAGSHSAGVASTQRHVVLSFSADTGDAVVGWVASVDGSPTAALSSEDARPEPRLATVLEPGQWWVHAAGVDAAGRLGAVTHFPVVVGDAEYVLDVPSGRHLWGLTRIGASCPATPSAVVQTISTDGARTDIGQLVSVEGVCGVDWDPIATSGGARVWPDGDYELVVVADGADVSETVPVRVADSDGPIARINADYSAGLITATEQADLLLTAMADSTELPAPYGVDGVSEAPEAAEVLAALTATGEIPDSLAADLTPTLLGSAMHGTHAPTRQGARVSATTYQPGCNQLIRYIRVFYDCVAVDGEFVALYQSGTVGATLPGAELPEVVAIALTSLQRARSIYESNGFQVPGETLIAPNPAYADGYGLSLPALVGPPVIVMSPGDFSDYLPHHELFHQVQYQYLGLPVVAAARMLASTDIYWWAEGTAEWAASFVQSADPSVNPTSEYADSLDTFMANSAGSLDAGRVHEPIDGGGPEYGSFVFAEFLAQKYGNDAIESTWDRIGNFFLPMPAAVSIAHIMADRGERFADEIQVFRQWMYPLDDVDGWGGFTTPDADPEGLWRDAIGESARVPHTSISLDGQHTEQSGELRLGPGGAAYVEISGPADLEGRLSVAVEGDANVAIIEGVGDFPTICGRGGGISMAAKPRGAVADSMVRADNAPTPSDSAWASLGSRWGYECRNAVLVVTNTHIPLPALPGASQAGWEDVTWSVRFAPDGVLLRNAQDTLSLGVFNTGALGYTSPGIDREGTYYVGFADGWGLSHLSLGGWASSGDFEGQGFQPTGFFFDTVRTDARTKTALTEIGDGGVSTLSVMHEIHPSGDPNLYAIDVTVSRIEVTAPPGGLYGHVRYRRSAEWDVTLSDWAGRMRSTWAKATGGDDTRVVSVSHTSTNYGPPMAQNGEVLGYVTSPPLYQGGDTLDLDLGRILPGESVAFTLYYGVAPTKAQAEAAVAAVGADVYYLVYAELPLGVQEATGVFAYRATTPTQ